MVETKYPGHKIVIQNKSFDIGNNIKIEEDLDTIYMTCSCDLPNISENGWSTANLKKYDNFQVYFKFFDDEISRQNAEVGDLQLIFTGYIDTLPVSEDKRYLHIFLGPASYQDLQHYLIAYCIDFKIL